MPFITSYLGNPIRGIAGEHILDKHNIMIGCDRSEVQSGLTYGNFVWYDSVAKKLVGNIANPAPTIHKAGWLSRDLTGAIDKSPSALTTNSLTNIANVLTQGLIIVNVYSPLVEPTEMGNVFLDPLTGIATADAINNIFVHCKFVKQVDTNLWLVQSILYYN